jgi:hypothetical protein
MMKMINDEKCRLFQTVWEVTQTEKCKCAIIVSAPLLYRTKGLFNYSDALWFSDDKGIQYI